MANERKIKRLIEANRAHADGKAAHADGVDIHDNPYLGGLRRNWEDGWKDAEEELTSKAKETT